MFLKIQPLFWLALSLDQKETKETNFAVFFSVISLITESEIIAQCYVETCFSDRSYNLFIFHIKLRHSIRLSLIKGY